MNKTKKLKCDECEFETIHNKSLSFHMRQHRRLADLSKENLVNELERQFLYRNKYMNMRAAGGQ